MARTSGGRAPYAAGAGSPASGSGSANEIRVLACSSASPVPSSWIAPGATATASRAVTLKYTASRPAEAEAGAVATAARRRSWTERCAFAVDGARARNVDRLAAGRIERKHAERIRRGPAGSPRRVTPMGQAARPMTPPKIEPRWSLICTSINEQAGVGRRRRSAGCTPGCPRRAPDCQSRSRARSARGHDRRIAARTGTGAGVVRRADDVAGAGQCGSISGVLLVPSLQVASSPRRRRARQ